MTQYIGVIGYPLRHSISPAFQQAALDYCGLDIRYQAWETAPDGLPSMVSSLRGSDRLGMNVTLPHKQAVVPLLDGTDEMAAAIGAVNTVAKAAGRLRGYNTDCTGFLRALRQDGGFDPAGARALLLGTGGAARAVAYALLTSGVESLGMAGRNSQHASSLRQGFLSLAQERRIRVSVEGWGSEGLAGTLPTYDLVVHATPMGMLHTPMDAESPLAELDITERTFVYDLVYNPSETPLLKQAREAGCPTLGGLSMLVYQGAEAFRLWTGREAPLSVMLAAARKALWGEDG